MPTRTSQSADAAASGAPVNGPGDDAQRWAGLMVQAQAGDRRAYHRLLSEITPYLRAIARRYLGGADGVEDAVQDVLLVVHSIRHTYEPGRPFKPWLSVIASRRMIDLLRRRTHRRAHEIEVDDEALDAAFDRADERAGPDQVLQRTVAERQLRTAVAQLPARQREAVELLRLHELSPRETRGLTRQTVGGLKVACHRALKTLKRSLTRGDAADET